MRQAAVAVFLFGLVGCAEGQQERTPPRPFWFRKTDFVRPGHVSTWDFNDPPISVCGQVVGCLLSGFAHYQPAPPAPAPSPPPRLSLIDPSSTPAPDQAGRKDSD